MRSMISPRASVMILVLSPLAMGEPNILVHERGRQTISPQCRRDSAVTGGNAIKLSEPGGADEGRQTVARGKRKRNFIKDENLCFEPMVSPILNNFLALLGD